MDVLVVLARAECEVVARHELIQAVWGTAAVTDAVLTNAVSELRRAFHESARAARQLETIPRRGYRLTGPIAFAQLDGPDPVRPRPLDEGPTHLTGAAAEHYREGLLLLRGSTYGQLERGIRAMREVVRREPSYAPAHCELARGYFLLMTWGRTAGSELLPLLEAAAGRAINLSPEETDAQLWSIMAGLGTSWHPQQALWPLGRLVQRDPSHPAARAALARCLASLGRLPEALELQRRAVDDDPFSPSLRTTLGFYLRLSGRLDDAERELTSTLELHPTWAISRVELARVHLAHGRPGAAIADLATVEPQWGAFLAAVQEDRQREVEAHLGAWEAAGSGVAPYWLAERCMWAGATERALNALERAMIEHQLHLLYVAVEPTFQPLHGGARFVFLLAALGLDTGR